MRNILAKELKIKFIEALNEVDDFSYEDGNPFLIKIGEIKYFIFLKNLSPAYFINSPDVTRVQLPFSEHFSKIFKAPFPFIILGYDVDNDTMVCWNHTKIKARLNTKSNVSLYSRNSLQALTNKETFKAGYLSNGEKIVVFKRESLPLFFEGLPTFFDDNNREFEIPQETNIVNEPVEIFETEKLSKILDNKLLSIIRPLLKQNRVLECVSICEKYFEGKYLEMKFRDWFNLVNELYREISSED